MSSTANSGLPSCEATQTARNYYNSPDADRFYAQVWGGEDIHVGLYRHADEPIKQASRRTVEQLADRLQATGEHADQPGQPVPLRVAPSRFAPIAADSLVLDIGSGYGGAARRLAERFGCRVTCVNVSEAENERNRQLNQAAGLSERIEVLDGTFEALPVDDASVDFVWSQDAILHAGDRRRVLAEVDRALRPGGRFVFTDPMQSDDCPAGVLDAILARIHLTNLGSPSFYRQVAAELGWQDVEFADHTDQLINHYRRVLETTQAMHASLAQKISAKYLSHMKAGLQRWVDGGKQGYLAWGIFVFAKPFAPQLGYRKLHLGQHSPRAQF